MKDFLKTNWWVFAGIVFCIIFLLFWSGCNNNSEETKKINHPTQKVTQKKCDTCLNQAKIDAQEIEHLKAELEKTSLRLEIAKKMVPTKIIYRTKTKTVKVPEVKKEDCSVLDNHPIDNGRKIDNSNAGKNVLRVWNPTHTKHKDFPYNKTGWDQAEAFTSSHNLQWNDKPDRATLPD